MSCTVGKKAGGVEYNTKGNLCSQPNSACKFNELNIQLQRRKKKKLKREKGQTDTVCTIDGV